MLRGVHEFVLDDVDPLVLRFPAQIIELTGLN